MWTSGSPYAIPAGNPYVSKPGRDEIWALGLRNPWRFSFDRENGDLYIGDVGQNQFEEIDFQAANTSGGVNFGWRCKEGAHDYNFTGDCPSLTLTDPIAEYSHTQGQSVTGGFVYRGQDFPALQDRYFYADYSFGKIWSMYKTNPSPVTWSAPELELDTGFNISAFGEDENGELYVVDYSGKIRRLADVNGPAPSLGTSRKLVSSPSADPNEVVTYTIQIANTGALSNQPIVLTDTIPTGLSYIPGSLTASSGNWSDANSPTLTWSADLNTSHTFTITYQVSVTGQVTGSIVNRAQLASPPGVSLPLAQSLSVPRTVLTTTVNDFFFPGSQPGALTAELRPSADCDTCHSAPIYDRWRGSMMSQAARDPLLWSALHVANIDAPNAGDFCLRCHTTRAWLGGRSHPADGSALFPIDVKDGVACALCHRMVDPLPSGGEAASLDNAIRGGLTDPPPAGFIGSAAVIVDPADNRRGPFSFGQSLLYHTAYQTNFFQQTSSAETRASLCGSCHNVHNPVLSWSQGRGQFWPNTMDAPAPDFDKEKLFPVETTYDEWLYSKFAEGGVYMPDFAELKQGGIVETCQDCHMPRRTGVAADLAFNPTNRDCSPGNCLPEHSFVGANTWVPKLLVNPDWRLNAASEATYLQANILSAEEMLTRAATLSVTLTYSGTEKFALVRVTNNTGHKLPTGYPEGRRMWINLKAFDSSGVLVYESGAYDSATGMLTIDSDIKVFEAKQGITPELAEVLKLPPGESFHFVLNNTVIKDNRIPPAGVTQAEYDRPGLRPVGADYLDPLSGSLKHSDDSSYLLPPSADRFLATLYYQTSSKEYIDFLRKTGGVDGQSLGALWDETKSPPQLVALAAYKANSCFLPWILH